MEFFTSVRNLFIDLFLYFCDSEPSTLFHSDQWKQHSCVVSYWSWPKKVVKIILKFLQTAFFYYRKMSIYFKTFCLFPYSKRAKLLYNVFTNLYNHNTELTDIAFQSKWKLVWRWLFIGGVKSKSRGLHVQSFDEFCHTNEHQTPQGMFSVEYTVGS